MKSSEPLTHRRHTIRTQQRGGEWRAQAMRGNRMIGPVQVAASETAAVLAVRDQLDQQAAAERASRGPDGFPAASVGLDAFAELRPTQSQLAMLNAHRRAPGFLITATALAEAAGDASYETANSQYGGLGRALAEEMEWTPDLRARDGQPIWTMALAVEGSRSDNDQWRWLLRPEVAQAAEQVLGPVWLP